MSLAGRNVATLTVACTLVVTPAGAQIPLNSQHLSVQNYEYPAHTPGDWQDYEVYGFYQPVNAGSATVKPRLYLLPSLTVRAGAVSFSDANGMPLTPTNCASQPVGSVTIRVAVNAALPNQMQQVAVGAGLMGVGAERFRAPWELQPNGLPVMWAPMMGLPPVVHAVQQVYGQYSQELQRQSEYMTRYQAYNVSTAALNELNLDLVVDGEVVATTRFSGTTVTGSTSTLNLGLRSPSVFDCNRILSGNYSIIARYRFMDTGSATVNARYDWRKAISQFISETQRASTSSRNSGWRVLGFGSRKSRVKRSLDSSTNVQGSAGTIENTTIVAFDATDDMVRRFESSFFPELSKQNVITEHMAAANAARSDGKPDLAAAHERYAAALTNGAEQLEVDAVGAAAALNEGDYATFLAKGVRMSNSSDTRTDNFRRVISVNVSEVVQREWNDVRVVTKERETSAPVRILSAGQTEATLGGFAGAPFQFGFLQNSWNPTWQQRTGLLVGGIAPTGSLAAAGIQPGMIIMSVNGTDVSSFSDVTQAMDGVSPGEYIPVRTLWNTGAWAPPYPPQLGTTQTHNVRVGSRPARAAQ